MKYFWAGALFAFTALNFGIYLATFSGLWFAISLGFAVDFLSQRRN